MHERARLLEPLLPRPGGAHGRGGAVPPREHVSDEAFADIMRPYIQAPAQFTEATYDVVLIDGRYRTACAWAVLPYLKETSASCGTITAAIAWNAHPSDGALFQFDKTARDAKTHGPQSRMYSKTAARIFDRAEEHVDALAVFRVKPSVLQRCGGNCSGSGRGGCISRACPVDQRTRTMWHRRACVV